MFLIPYRETHSCLYANKVDGPNIYRGTFAGTDPTKEIKSFSVHTAEPRYCEFYPANTATSHRSQHLQVKRTR